jgi:hypothetical protein
MRIRTIKPDFWTDAKVSKLTYLARLLFIGLWNVADDEGRFKSDPRILKGSVFPVDDKTTVEKITGALSELSVSRLVFLTEIGGEQYGCCPNFKKHQKINRPSPSRLPPVTAPSVSPHGVITEGSRTEVEEEVEVEVEEEEEEEEDCASLPPQDNTADITLAWNTLGKPFSEVRMTDKRKRTIENRLCNSFWAENWRKTLDLVKASTFCSGKNDRGWVADIDWFIRPDTVTKLTEGKYGNKEDPIMAGCPFDDDENRRIYRAMHAQSGA